MPIHRWSCPRQRTPENPRRRRLRRWAKRLRRFKSKNQKTASYAESRNGCHFLHAASGTTTHVGCPPGSTHMSSVDKCLLVRPSYSRPVSRVHHGEQVWDRVGVACYVVPALGQAEAV